MCGVNRVLFASQLRHGLLDHDNALLFDPCFHVGKFQATVIIPETTPFTLKQKYPIVLPGSTKINEKSVILVMIFRPEAKTFVGYGYPDSVFRAEHACALGFLHRFAQHRSKCHICYHAFLHARDPYHTCMKTLRAFADF